MKETEEIELQDVDLFADYLEFQMLPLKPLYQASEKLNGQM
ncbi:MAG: hypothetical protein ACTSP9_16155 [Promethearchaeota archaeon]